MNENYKIYSSCYGCPFHDEEGSCFVSASNCDRQTITVVNKNTGEEITGSEKDQVISSLNLVTYTM